MAVSPSAAVTGHVIYIKYFVSNQAILTQIKHVVLIQQIYKQDSTDYILVFSF